MYNSYNDFGLESLEVLAVALPWLWLWLSITKGSNDLKSETTAKAESQDHGSHDQSHGKATAKTSRLSKPKSL